MPGQNKKYKDEIMKKDLIELLETVKKETLKTNAVEEFLKTFNKDELEMYRKKKHFGPFGLNKEPLIKKIVEHWKSSKTEEEGKKLPRSAGEVKETESGDSRLPQETEEPGEELLPLADEVKETESGDSRLPQETEEPGEELLPVADDVKELKKQVSTLVKQMQNISIGSGDPTTENTKETTENTK